MLFNLVTLTYLLPSIKALTTLKQSSDMQPTVNSLQIPSGIITASQAHGALRHHKSSFTSVQVFPALIHERSNPFVSPSGFSTLKTLSIVINSTDLFNSMENSIQTPSGEMRLSPAEMVALIPAAVLAASPTSFASPSEGSTSPSSVFVSPSDDNVSLAGTTGSPRTSTTVPALQTSDTQTFLGSGFSFSISSLMTIIAQLPKTPSIDAQTMTGNKPSQYHTDSQTPTSGGVVEISGKVISLAPGGSGVAVGTGTRALSANSTAGFGPGSNVTGVQSFKGRALGGRDGLWSSSMVVLVGVAVLLWL